MLASMRQKLDKARALLHKDYLAQRDTYIFFRQWQHHVDHALCALWRKLPSSLTHRSVLLAVGGYGRGALFPYSDIDTTIVLKKPPDRKEKSALAAFETALWDLGLRIGHGAYVLDEFENFAQWDIATQTALIEYRYLCGSRNLYRLFENSLRQYFDFSSFYKAKCFEQEQRHLKYRDTLYNLEPNIKESPGGLRDIHMIRWLIRGIKLVDERARQSQNIYCPPWLTTYELRSLRQQEIKLSTWRIHLHLLAGRAEERLLFDHQNALADIVGTHAQASLYRGEILMQHYYRAAQHIRRLNLLFMQLVYEYLHPLPKAKALDNCFNQRGTTLDIVHSDIFTDTPSAIFDTFLHWQHQKEIDGLSANTLRALNRAYRYINNSFRKNRSNQDKFVAFFRGQRTITHATRIMNLYGIIGAYLPAFGYIVGKMQHDLFHTYTVDEHILMTVRNLRRFSLEAHAHEYPLCSRLMMDFKNPEILFFAAFFHDIAKSRGGDHSLRGAEIARRFCKKHRIAQEDTAFIVWLVKAHLWMSFTAQKYDISSPDVVHAFVRKVKNEKRLIALYLLTVADIRATSPNIWNPWKAQLLESLFLSAHAQLHHKDIFDTIERKQQQAITLLKKEKKTSDDIPLWHLLDNTYFQRHHVDELVWHASALSEHLRTRIPRISIRPLPKKAGIQFLVYLSDRQKLFAQLCVFFGTHQLNILDAKIHTTHHGYALDTFNVQTKDMYLLENNEKALNAMAQRLAVFLGQPFAALPPLGKRPRRSRHYPLVPQIRISADSNDLHYILEITTGDRPVLLAHIASMLADDNIDIKSARINTMGERVEDVFILSGKALLHTENRAALEIRLQNLLQTD